MNGMDAFPHERLVKQLRFVIEADKIKQIIRKTPIFDGSRFENDAEHSWTVSLMAVLLAEHAAVDVDVLKVVKMLLIHDLVEIDAGDTFLYAADRAAARAGEEAAARRIFGALDTDQSGELYALWCEFEDRRTPEARFAAAFDRLEPILQNYLTEGSSWKRHRVTYEMVVRMNRHICEGSETLWEFVRFLLDSAVENGYLEKEESGGTADGTAGGDSPV